jgi:hypothetical protein
MKNHPAKKRKANKAKCVRFIRQINCQLRAEVAKKAERRKIVEK